jgi:outer membrane protein OmpA-like peptidoglycan-associated protein
MKSNPIFVACRLLICLALLSCAACDTFPILPTTTEAPAAEQPAPIVPPAPPATPSATPSTAPPTAVPVPDSVPDGAPPTSAKPAQTSDALAPEAVYILDAEKNAPLPDSVEQSLRNIAARLKTRRDVVIRLESYVPNSGSREMNIGLSRQAVDSIRRRLVALGVPSYRIKQSLLGAEHPGAVRLDQRRVELFVLPLPR